MKTSAIKTGYIGLVRKPNLETLDGVAEEAIAELTKGRDFYHVMWLYRDANEELRVSEMVMPSWRDVTLAERLVDIDGELWIGVTPWVISGQPEKVMDYLNWFAGQPQLHPYGTTSLLPTGISSDFGIPIDPLKEQPVCSLHVERGVLTIEQGDIDRLWTPNDCAAFCESIEQYEGV
ncbi:MAG: hypothetical protein ABSA86_11455 [Oryzomonas sp.]